MAEYNGPTNEAEADTQVVRPYLTAIGLQAVQIRAQQTFSFKFGRATLTNSPSAIRRATVGARLDFLVTSDEGRPLLIFELKAPEEALSDEDRDQAISYARLVHPMAPVAVVTNTRETRIYDTATKSRIESLADSRLLSPVSLSAEEDLQARREALEHFIGYSAQNVLAFAAGQRRLRMASLRAGENDLSRKYIPAAYVTRTSLRHAVEGFLRSEKVTFAVVGTSGLGKTCEMCALADSLGVEHAAFFFSGGELSAPIAVALADEFNFFFTEGLSTPQLLRRLDSFAQRTARPVVLVLDGVDESTQQEIAAQLNDLATRLEQFEGRIKLIVSAKPENWTSLSTFRGVPRPLQRALFVVGESESPLASNLPRPAEQVDGNVRASFVLGPFSNAERDEAITRYTQSFGLSRHEATKWGYALLEAVRDPFMLRVVVEVVHTTGTLPSDPSEPELLARYLHAHLARILAPQAGLEVLIQLAEALAGHEVSADSWEERPPTWRRDKPRPSPPSVLERQLRERVSGETGQQVVEELVSFGLLLRLRDDTGRSRLAFAYDRVRDHILATFVYRFPALDAAAFSEATARCLSSAAGAAALRSYLPFVTEAQWPGFLETAERQVETMLNEYEKLLLHVTPLVRVAMDPRGRFQKIGAAFACARGETWFELGLYARANERVRRVTYFSKAHEMARPSPGVPLPPGRIATSRGTIGFWFLRDPKGYALRHFREQLIEVVKDGELDETGDLYLLQERIVAIAHAERRALQLPQGSSPFRTIADYFLAIDLYPLDLRDLDRRVQEALAVMVLTEDARTNARRRAEEDEIATATREGRPPNPVRSYSLGDAKQFDRMVREQAKAIVAAGQRFTTLFESGDIAVLARALELVLPRIQVIRDPLVPLPDRPHPHPGQAFEDGYSDEQLAAFLERIYEAARHAEKRIRQGSFSPELQRLLADDSDTLLGILCKNGTRGRIRASRYGARWPPSPCTFVIQILSSPAAYRLWFFDRVRRIRSFLAV